MLTAVEFIKGQHVEFRDRRAGMVKATIVGQCTNPQAVRVLVDGRKVPVNIYRGDLRLTRPAANDLED